MQISVGRIIHVRENIGVGRVSATGDCMAAIITSRPRVSTGEFNATIFSPHGAYAEAARRISLNASSVRWHDPRECPMNADYVSPDEYARIVGTDQPT